MVGENCANTYIVTNDPRTPNEHTTCEGSPELELNTGEFSGHTSCKIGIPVKYQGIIAQHSLEHRDLFHTWGNCDINSCF